MAFPDPQRIFAPDLDFEALEAEAWQYQLTHNPVVKRFAGLLGRTDFFLPIRFFRDFEVKTGDWEPNLVFRSSGTTGQVSSRHFVRDAALYQESLHRGFRHFYGDQSPVIFALLPNYLERGDSSLVYMVTDWIRAFGQSESGFYLYDHDALYKGLVEALEQNQSILLIGVTFALLDFAEAYQLDLPPEVVVMETGGMKGKRREMVRAEVHALLQSSFGRAQIHSEYGMTELLSQGYALDGTHFQSPPWMKVVITDPYVPGRVLAPGQTGRINIVDLANLDSCIRIQTDDLGRMDEAGRFTVLGRLDHAELRGCNLMVE